MERRILKNKIISVLLLVVILAADFNFLPLQSIINQTSQSAQIMVAYAATTKPGKWIKESNGKWWYKHTDGTYTKNGWEYINGYWYHFDSSGYMQTGWLKVDGKWYHLNSEGKMHIGWVKIGNYWYHFDSTGVMHTGWQKLNGNWYYFNSDGIRQVGWQQVDGKWYHLNSEGIMETGWVKIGNYWYHFDSTGVRQTGWQKLNGNWYYFNSDGIRQVGWQQVDGKWYHLNSEGIMETGWQKLNGDWYYFDSTGVRQTGWLKLDDKWYYLNSSGIMQIGWVKLNDKWYYFEPDSGKMRIQSLFTGSATYTFALSGELVQTQLGVVKHFQLESLLCWAASAQIVGPYRMNFTITQEEIVREVKGIYANLSATSEETIEALSVASNYTKNARLREPLKFTQVVSEIDNNKPFIIKLEYTKKKLGHVVVCAGYNLKDKSVYIVNPNISVKSEYYDYFKLIDNILINNQECKCAYMYIY